MIFLTHCVFSMAWPCIILHPASGQSPDVIVRFPVLIHLNESAKFHYEAIGRLPAL